MNRLSKFLNITLIGLTAFFGLNSCLESDDLMTDNAKTGGLIEVTPSLQYKPGSTESVEVEILLYRGPRVKTVKVYKQFFHYYDNAGSVDLLESEEVLLGAISIDEDNSKDTLLVGKSYSWADLVQGIPQLPNGYDIPSDPVGADVGDFFTLRYVSELSDGGEVTCLPQTYIVVANFFAGYYQSHFVYFHPTLGGSYPTEPYYDDILLKELFTFSNLGCSMYFGLWEDAEMDIIVNGDNSISFTVSNFNYIVNEGDPYDATKVSHYDPITRTIYLYYYYDASGGYRVFWETLTPYSGK